VGGDPLALSGIADENLEQGVQAWQPTDKQLREMSDLSKQTEYFFAFGSRDSLNSA
jgi:hypothetical protein